jgi:lysophospholipase L1-like esterase
MWEWWFWTVRKRVYWHIGQRDCGVHGHGPLMVVMGDSLTSPYSGFMFPWQVWVRRVGREGYRTVNLGLGGQTTGDMCRRIEQFLTEGQPEIAVLFAGSVDAELCIDPAETERNVAFMVKWLRENGVRNVALLGPGMLNLPQVPEHLAQNPNWLSATCNLRAMFRELALQHDVVFVDLAQFLRDRIVRGEDPDFSRVAYRPWRSIHASRKDGHFNAYGHRLIAEAFLSATADWRPAHSPRR